MSDLAGVVAIDTAMCNIDKAMKAALDPKLPGAATAYKAAFGADPAVWATVSPFKHVAKGKGIAPFLLFASDDRPTIAAQVKPLIEKLEAAGVEATMQHGKGPAHSPHETYMGVDGDESTEVLVQFLNRHSGPE